MNPSNPASFNHCNAFLSTGRRYHFVDQLPANYDPSITITLLCIHGFPDLWYGWRYQIKPWVQLGYRVVVPDMVGYGGSDKPEDPVNYTPRRISDDVAALMDLLHISRAVIIGHDWGCFMASRFSLWHPDRLLALVLLSVPFVPPAKEYLSLEQMVERFPNWGYQLYFQEKSSNVDIEKHLPEFFKLIYRIKRRGSSPSPKNPHLSKWTLAGGLKQLFTSKSFTSGFSTADTGILKEHEFEYYLSQFDKSLDGPLNYYRTTRYRFEEELDSHMLQAPRSDLPVLLIIGDEDPTTNQRSLYLTRKYIPQAKIELIDGAGHWVMAERKEYINESIPRFLQEVLPNSVQNRL